MPPFSLPDHPVLSVAHIQLCRSFHCDCKPLSSWHRAAVIFLPPFHLSLSLAELLLVTCPGKKQARVTRHCGRFGFSEIGGGRESKATIQQFALVFSLQREVPAPAGRLPQRAGQPAHRTCRGTKRHSGLCATQDFHNTTGDALQAIEPILSVAVWFGFVSYTRHSTELLLEAKLSSQQIMPSTEVAVSWARGQANMSSSVPTHPPQFTLCPSCHSRLPHLSLHPSTHMLFSVLTLYMLSSSSHSPTK